MILHSCSKYHSPHPTRRDSDEKQFFSAIVVFSLVIFAFNISESHAQSQPCLDFRDFPIISLLPSPVVAPPGETIPSDIHLRYIIGEDDEDPNNSETDDSYYFQTYNITYEDWDEDLEQMVYRPGIFTGLSAPNWGYLEITFDNPLNSGLLTFMMIHCNQPEIEYQLWGYNGLPLTSGWESSDAFPDFEQEIPTITEPIEERIYSIAITDYFNPSMPIKKIWVRNLSGKNYFFKICAN